jgi:glycosyltransferase involved in cell wall biosynthesis
MSRAEVTRRLLGARAFVFPSAWYEPFGMVLVEALSAGLPVITSNASEAPAIVDAPSSLVVPVGDASALAAALGLLGDELVDRFGRRNRERFEEQFTEQRGLERLEALYADAIANRRSQ